MYFNFEGRDLEIKRSGRYRWEQAIIPFIIKPLIQRKQAKLSRYTIRGLCYVLESFGVVPKTERDFNKVYDAMTTARKNGSIDMDAFVDNSRYRIKKFNDRYRSIKQQVNDTLRDLENIVFTDGSKKDIPKWYNQPYYVEVWVEKFSFAEVLYQILRDRHVEIIPNRGWSSITFLENNIWNLIGKLHDNPDVHAKVLYFGDLDPSGWVMDEHYVKEIKRKMFTTRDRFEFKRVAITKEQLDTFNLRGKTNPNPEVMTKLRNNPNRTKFKTEFGSLFQIELEALEASPEFEDMVKREIDSLYNENVYQEVLELPENSLTEEQKNKIVNSWARDKILRFRPGPPF